MSQYHKISGDGVAATTTPVSAAAGGVRVRPGKIVCCYTIFVAPDPGWSDYVIAQYRAITESTKMEITVTVPDTLKLGKNGAIGTLTVDWAKVPRNVLDHVAGVYFAQAITDRANSGGKDATPAERFALAEKKLADWYAGTVRARGEGDGEPADPFEAECHKIAKADIHAFYMNEKAYEGIPKGTKDRMLWAANKRRASNGLEPLESVADVIATYLGNEKVRAAVEKRARRAMAERATAAENMTV